MNMKGMIVRHKTVSAIVLLLVAGGGYYFGYFRPSSSADGTATPPVVVNVTRGDLRVTVTGSGQVYAKDEVALQPVAAGDAIEVVSVAVRNDQEVKKDDLIATLDTSDAEKAVRDAEFTLRSAEIRMRQTEKLYDNETEDDKLNRQTQEVTLAQARHKLADAREDLEEYRIRAPFDGVVTGLAVAAGDSVSRSDTVASVISREMYARVSLNEIDAVGVTEGDTVTLSFTALDGTVVEGTVSKMDTIGTVSQDVVSYDAEISFNSASLPKLKPGMSVDVSIVTEEKTGVLSVPIAAVGSGPGGNPYVMVPSDDGGFQRARVETGVSTDTAIEIVSGLSEGQEIVLNVGSVEAATVTGSGTGTNRTQDATSSLMRIPGTGSGMGTRPPGM